MSRTIITIKSTQIASNPPSSILSLSTSATLQADDQTQRGLLWNGSLNPYAPSDQPSGDRRELLIVDGKGSRQFNCF